jgi:hypothetical protein
VTRPGERTLVAIGIVAVVVIALGVAAWRGGWFSDDATLARSDRVSATAVITPRSHLFADTVGARLDLVFSRTFVPVGSVHVDASFTPYVVQTSSRRRTDHGDSTRLTYLYRLSCLALGCLPKGGEKTFELPKAIVTYGSGSGGASSARVTWPNLTVAARVGPADREQPELQASLRPLPGPSYRIRPAVVTGLSLAGALVLLIVAVVLLAPALPRTLGLRVPAWARRRQRPLTPLERALARVRAAGSNGSGDERRALEHLAVELAGSGETGLARNARRLAWSPGRPPADGLRDLSTEVERVIEMAR